MGGIFSGRKPAQTTKPFPEEFITLDVRTLQKEGLLEAKQSYNLHQYSCGRKVGILAVTAHQNRLSLSYAACHEQTRQLNPQSTTIVWTPCHFGGRRPWFLCPNEHCGKRVAILYGPHSFLCRHCQGIAYQSQRENQLQRMFRKLEALQTGFSDAPKAMHSRELSRPKGMHQRTFKSLEGRHEALVSEIRLKQINELIELDEKFGAKLSKIESL